MPQHLKSTFKHQPITSMKSRRIPRSVRGSVSCLFAPFPLHPRRAVTPFVRRRSMFPPQCPLRGSAVCPTDPPSTTEGARLPLRRTDHRVHRPKWSGRGVTQRWRGGPRSAESRYRRAPQPARRYCYGWPSAHRAEGLVSGVVWVLAPPLVTVVGDVTSPGGVTSLGDQR